MAKRSAVAKSFPPALAPPLDDVARIQLGAELGIEEAGSLHRQLLGAVDEPRVVELDGHEVRSVHTAALELFCLFCRDRREAGHETRWSQPSETLRSAAALLGMTSLLALTREQRVEVAA
ncbi:MAG: STAS domain-containing protein [Stagnimonas sp.]|nr:STAS domain-containing protein [Stagnimonas sp.]